VSKKARLEVDSRKLLEEADAMTLEAENKNDLLLLTKSNAIRRAAGEKLIDVQNAAKLLETCENDNVLKNNCSCEICAVYRLVLLF
jgi:hypothetical protein